MNRKRREIHGEIIEEGSGMDDRGGGGEREEMHEDKIEEGNSGGEDRVKVW